MNTIKDLGKLAIKVVLILLFVNLVVDVIDSILPSSLPSISDLVYNPLRTLKSFVKSFGEQPAG